MINDKSNERDNRDGDNSSSNNDNDSGARKKRTRVGDLRRQPFDISQSDRDRNPYRQSNTEDRGGDSSRGDRPSRSQEPERGGYRGQGNDRDRNRTYPSGGGERREGYQGQNDNRGGGYQGQSDNRRGGYQSQGDNRRGGYQGQGSNRGGGYQGQNDSRSGGYQGQSDNRRGGYQSQGDNRRDGYQGGQGNTRGGYQGQNDNRGGGYQGQSDNRRGGYQGQSDNRRGGHGQGNNRGGGYNQRPGGRPQGDRKPQFQPQKRVVQPVKYKENLAPDTEMRLNRYLSNAGVCSRREADAFIEKGLVKVNGEVVDQLGSKVLVSDLVTFKDVPVQLESKVYVLLNKPKNTVTTSDDPQNRTTVMDLVQNACEERIYPVGRLDRNTTGVLLITNDGDLASKLMHPKYEKKKVYQVTLDKPVSAQHMQVIADGIELEDGEIHADSIAYMDEENLNIVGIEIHSGRNRIVRRMFEHLEYRVVNLDRVYFAGLTKKNVRRGHWRYLTEKEVNMLRMGAFE